MNIENYIPPLQETVDEEQKNAEIERMVKEISDVAPQASWETYSEGKSYGLRISLPHDCFIKGNLEYKSNGRALLYVVMFQVNNALSGKGIGNRLMRAFVKEGMEYDAVELNGHVTSESALKTRARVFGEENLEFYNHITKEKMDITYTQALARNLFDCDVRVNLEKIDTSGWEVSERKDE